MRLVVISDTHMPFNADSFPEQLIKDIKKSDLVLHAGDLVDLDVLAEIEKIKPVVAVAGNMDTAQTKKILQEKRILKLHGFNIGLIHGWGPAHSVLKKVINEFKEIKDLDCVVYGHTHNASVDNIDGVIYFNPGSLTDKTFALYNSYGILELTEKINPRIVKID